MSSRNDSGAVFADSYDGPKRLWEFPEGNHGTVMLQPPAIWNQIVEFWKSNHPGF